MFKNQDQNKSLRITFDTKKLSHSQQRLIKGITCTLFQLLTAESEEEYFESSKELLKQCATSIKQSNYTSKLTSAQSDQAIEFALDELTEAMDHSSLINLDN